MKTFAPIAGWIGTFLILGAYALLSYGAIQGRSVEYQLMNLFGSIGMCINVAYGRVWSGVALQVAFSAIAIATVISVLLK